LLISCEVHTGRLATEIATEIANKLKHVRIRQLSLGVNVKLAVIEENKYDNRLS
jgi:hypothetical protein